MPIEAIADARHKNTIFLIVFLVSVIPKYATKIIINTETIKKLITNYKKTS